MGLSHALNSAYSGLAVNSRRADVTSHNIANASTPGFARRSLETHAVAYAGVGSGVRADNTVLAEDKGLTANRRLADADAGGKSELADSWQRLAQIVGTADDPSAMTERYAELEDSLRAFADNPASSNLQLDVVQASKDVVEGFGDMQRQLLDMRVEADQEIGRLIDQVNETLHQIDAINKDIRKESGVNGDVSELAAQRSLLVDQLSEIVPIKTFPTDNDGLNVMTDTGYLLVSEGRVFELEFDPAPTVTADMDLIGGAPGALSGLTHHSQDVTPPTSDVLGSGRLAALFEIRDVATVDVQTKIDALAQDLVDRFDAVSATAPGLLIDPAAAPTTPGLAGRLAVAAEVDPDQGGFTWRLRDGLDALVEGDAGDNTHAVALLEAITTAQSAPADTGVTGVASSYDLMAGVTSIVATKALSAEQSATLRLARQETLVKAETTALGVDLDYELQELNLIQTAYAANARVMQVVDQMIQQLLEI